MSWVYSIECKKELFFSLSFFNIIVDFLNCMLLLFSVVNVNLWANNFEDTVSIIFLPKKAKDKNNLNNLFVCLLTFLTVSTSTTHMGDLFVVTLQRIENLEGGNLHLWHCVVCLTHTEPKLILETLIWKSFSKWLNLIFMSQNVFDSLEVQCWIITDIVLVKC